ncbi:hypothetical protein AB0K14_04760 [Actinosynnema sp. NPDC050801]|uniref:hypothetical protein n=1 Tax=unclassified Actinosynnema TaxID=2637065 RepID=UPI0033FEA859
MDQLGEGREDMLGKLAAHASDQSSVHQAGRDVINQHINTQNINTQHVYYQPSVPVVPVPPPLPSRHLPFLLRVALRLAGIGTFLGLNQALMDWSPRPEDKGNMVVTMALLTGVVASCFATYMTGYAVYLAVRALISNMAEDGHDRWWLRGMVQRLAIAVGCWSVALLAFFFISR